jgi:hypothetical protein
MNLRPRSLARWSALLLALLLTAPAAPLQAQEASCPDKGGTPKTHGRRFLQIGQRDLKAGRHLDALGAFQISYACDPQPAALLGLADAQRGFGRLIEAYANYQRLIAMPGVTEKQREDAADGMLDIDRKTGVVRVVVDPADATVELDGEARKDLSQQIRVMSGSHALRAQRSGYKKAEQSFIVDPGAKRTITLTLERDLTVGTLMVREAKSGDAHLVIEGLDAGPLPWTGSLAPGTYSVWIASESGASEPSNVDIAVGQTATVTLQLTPFPKPKSAKKAAKKPKQRSCESDNDCEGDDLCEEGKCRKTKTRKVESDEYEDLPPAKEGEDCGDRECGAGLKCVQYRCVQKVLAPYGTRLALSADWATIAGVGGNPHFPGPAHAVMGRLEVPIALNVRYRLGIGYFNLNARSGMRGSPLGFGFPITAWRREASEIVIEPGIDAAMFSETAILSNADYFASTAVWARLVYKYRNFVVSVVPVNLEIIWLRGIGTHSKTGEAWGGSGINFGGGIGLGVLL